MVCRPLRGLESFTTIDLGFARKASLHPRLYAFACSAGWNLLQLLTWGSLAKPRFTPGFMLSPAPQALRTLSFKTLSSPASRAANGGLYLTIKRNVHRIQFR